MLHTDYFKNISIGFAAKISGLAANFIFAFLISKKWGAEGMGAFALTTTYALLFIYIGKIGLDSAFLRFTSLYLANNEPEKIWGLYLKILRLLLPIVSLLSFSLIIGSHFIANNLIGKPNHSEYLFYAGLIMIPTILAMINSEGLRASNHPSKFIFIQNASSYLISLILLLIISMFIPVIHDVVLLPIWIFLFASILTMLISTFWWLGVIFERKVKTSFLETRQNIFKVTLPLFASSMLILILGWTDSLLLGYYYSEFEVGIYNIALKISNLVFMPMIIIGSLMAPKFSKLYIKSDHSQFRNSVYKSIQLTFLLSLPIFLILVFFSSFILSFFGNDFKNASLVLILLASAQLINALSGPKEILLQMTGNEVFLSKVMLLAVSINIGLNFILIPLYGVNGAAFSSIISMITWNMATIYFAFKNLRINIFIIRLIYFE